MLCAADLWPLPCDESKKTGLPLLELLVMVKNAGPGFREVMEQNLPVVEDWTVLDTGSTDGTLELLKELQLKFPGQVFQEPFTNFRDSRNRLLELSRKRCTFQIILDDTYVIQNGSRLREFLTLARTAPENAFDSFSIFLRETSAANIQYLSNRILLTSKQLRYDARFRIHEIITPNHCYSIPFQFGSLLDISSDYMLERTSARKAKDIEMLLEDHKAYPNCPRIYYYLAETYLWAKDYEKAAYWYMKRADVPPDTPDNYDEEQYDAKYKLGVVHQYHLPTEWPMVEAFYRKAHEFMPSRPEAMFMIGLHYAEAGDSDKAFQHLREAYKIGAPTGGMNLKLWQHTYHLPLHLAPLCLQRREYALGFELTQLFYQHLAENRLPDRPFMAKLHQIYKTMLPVPPQASVFPVQTGWIVFVTTSGWQPYNGETLRSKGLGGSENCIIRLAEAVAKANAKAVAKPAIIFCPCDKPASSYNGVYYYDISSYPAFLRQNSKNIQVVLLQRTPDYMLLTIEHQVYCYMHYHDTFGAEEVLVKPESPYFLGAICLSQWHKQLFQNIFPAISCQVQPYGIDFPADLPTPKQRKPHSFVYTSFPNRGLIVLVRDLWPRITQKWPDAKLALFCDFQNLWLRNVAGPEMQELEAEIGKYPASIKNYGWQPPMTIRSVLRDTEFFLYPCIFAETFCLAVLEAQAYGLRVITCDLGALPETVRTGTILPGDPRTPEWQEKALAALEVQEPAKKESLQCFSYEQVLKNWEPVVNQT